MYTHVHIGWIYAVHESASREHALPQGYTWLSRDARQNTRGQTFWQSGNRRRGAYQDDEFTTRPAALKMKTPETRDRIYWGSHMQHIYRERVQWGQLGHSQQEVLQSSQHRKDTRREKTRRPNTKTKDRTIAKISVRGERIVGSACGNGGSPERQGSPRNVFTGSGHP